MLRLALVLAAIVFGASAFAQQSGSLQVTGAWARATPKGAQVGGGYLKITNNGTRRTG